MRLFYLFQTGNHISLETRGQTFARRTATQKLLTASAFCWWLCRLCWGWRRVRLMDCIISVTIYCTAYKGASWDTWKSLWPASTHTQNVSSCKIWIINASRSTPLPPSPPPPPLRLPARVVPELCLKHTNCGLWAGGLLNWIVWAPPRINSNEPAGSQKKKGILPGKPGHGCTLHAGTAPEAGS